MARENAEKAAEEEEAAEQTQSALKSPITEVGAAMEAHSDKDDAAADVNESADDLSGTANGKQHCHVKLI